MTLSKINGLNTLDQSEHQFTDEDDYGLSDVESSMNTSSSFFKRVSGLRDLDAGSVDISENGQTDEECEGPNLALDQLSISSPSLVGLSSDTEVPETSSDADFKVETPKTTNSAKTENIIDRKTENETIPRLSERSVGKSSETLTDTFKSNNINCLRPSYSQVLIDPTFSLEHLVIPNIPLETEDEEGKISSGAREQVRSEVNKILRFKSILSEVNIDLERLKQLAWSGIPRELRSMSWQLLLGYLPTNSERRKSTLARKRQEYRDGVSQTFSKPLDQTMWHQISIDIPRTSPGIKLFGYPSTQQAMERILYLWAIRHPASGYVQGINDLVTPLFMTFLSAYVDTDDLRSYDPAQLPKTVLDTVEADTLWCLTKLLDGIQDNYIHAQPGIHRQVHDLQQLTSRIDCDLVRHLKDQHVEFMQFSFRWMNCLLMRELSLDNVIRMWDTYMAEDGSKGFSQFHVYVCAAFLVKWSGSLMTMDFSEIMMFLQALPTQEWQHSDIELLLSEAFMWQSLFENAIAHLN
ncbi:RabGAP/TBC [Nadsonia fulvescens var. elongata DSM 6958]|uniref:RabGAP/TBC n=1 Tax=Nadsonia fulvescens var. elongata DSM 6958 TaxID=857566 RepID=A0A1E3PFV3_9ASCO|nr:RabGAP/TBC [Nadsonia fulvescens var. elongata DSM 6958]